MTGSISTTTGRWFSSRLLKWYALHGRHSLPWQSPSSPYRTWVSEIMLQQTQVTTVIPYFLRFIEAFPTVQILARTPINQVLHYWAGLGYYARAKNLHRAAEIIITEHQGQFPKTVADWTTLPGIGRSTAGAIVSQSFNLRAPILDGNVKRVLCRFEGIKGWPGQKDVENTLWELAEHFTPTNSAADYTQAIMDLGATCCTKSKPRCHECPLHLKCFAYLHQKQLELPERKPKKTTPTKTVHIMVLQTECGHLLLESRPLKGIWSGLWSFPEFPDEASVNAFAKGLGLRHKRAKSLPLIKHTFSHYHLHLIPQYHLLSKALPLKKKNRPLAWLNAESIKQRGLPAPIQTLVRQLGVLP